MKNKIAFFLVTLFISISCFAQKEPMTREEKDEKNAERAARVSAKNDYAIFRKQIMALRQFDVERQKIPALRKQSKMTVKVLAVIDSNENDAEGDSKTLQGYIRQDVGDNATNMYEILFDRVQKKIISVKHTQEAIDADNELQEDQGDKATPEKKEPHKAVKKKSKDDDDDDAPEAKPVKGKQKDKDEDD